MRLFFLRHGKAEEHSASLRDYDRRLTGEGIEEMKRAASGLATIVDGMDIVVSSPLPRALETARIAATALKLPEDRLVVSDKLASGAFGIGELQAILAKTPVDRRVLLVGHEPDFSIVVRRLTGAAIEMKKAGLALVECDRPEPDSGVLCWLLTSRHLQSLARGTG